MKNILEHEKDFVKWETFYVITTNFFVIAAARFEL